VFSSFPIVPPLKRPAGHSAPAGTAIEELEKFFEATNGLESKKLKFQGWRGPAKAIKTTKKVAV
jgi:hypothetical protein